MRWTRRVNNNPRPRRVETACSCTCSCSTPRILGALLPLLMLLAGCPDAPKGPRFKGAGAQQPREGGTLRIAESSRVRTLDPRLGFDVVSAIAIELLFESLLTYDYDTQLVPALAESLPEVSEDGTRFTFTLRKGQRFHNGREVTAKDVAYSMERMLHPDEHTGAVFYGNIEGVAEYRAGEAAHIEGIQVLDRYRVRFVLTAPDQTFMHTMAMRFAAPVPREVVGKLGDREFARHPVGTGPYRLASWDPGVRLVFERFEGYAGRDQPHVDRIVFEENLASETAYLRFLNGELDMMQRMATPDRLQLSRLPKWQPHMAHFPRNDIYGLVMNCQMEPFDDVHVRRAVAFALDRERWAKISLGSRIPSGQVLPPAIPPHDPDLPTRQVFDLERARAELAKAGFPEGLPEPVTMWTTDSDGARKMGEMVQADLAKIGVEVKLKQVSFPVFLQETGKPKTAQMLTSGWVMDFPDPSNFLFLFQTSTISPSNSSNRSFHSNPELDALLRKAKVERDRDTRMALYAKANAIVARDAPWAFLGNGRETHAWQPYVRGYRPHPVYYLKVQNVWLDEPRQRIAQLLLHPERALLAALTPFGRLW